MNTPIVYIVDDDAAARDSLNLLCRTAGLKAECYDSAESFLGAYRPEQPGCLLLDVRMETMSGPDLHDELNRLGCRLSIIYLTGFGDIPMTVRAMRAGAVDFLTKPVEGAVLLERVQAALQQSRERFEQGETLAERQARFASLTAREREIMMLALAGESGKVIANRLGISYRTVEIHRCNILRKTETANMLALAQLAADCGITVSSAT
jgi:FixJ family two-component response regulator